MSNEDPKILQLYQSLQFCIKQLDQILHTKKKVPQMQLQTETNQVIVKVESLEISPEIKLLTEQLETLKRSQDELLQKLFNLRQVLRKLKEECKKKEEELEALQELVFEYKITKINPKYIELPREEINLYKSVKTYISLNQSKFSLFLKSLLHENKEDCFLNLDQLLNSIQDYYKNQQMYLKPKFSLNSVERMRLPSLEVRYFTNRRYKDQSLSLEQESRSQSFA